MKKTLVLSFLLLITLSAFTAHKFFISIYQINHSLQKKRVEITTRIFIDDLNKALKAKYAVTTHVGESAETTEDVVLMNKYLLEHFSIKVNGNKKALVYVNKELEKHADLISDKEVPKHCFNGCVFRPAKYHSNHI